MESVISVKNLTQRYGRGRIIYRDLNFEVPKGSILGLLGKNGTGKTTTINILMGFLKPQSGRCAIFGEDITTMTAATRTHSTATRGACAILFHDHLADREILFPLLSPMESGRLL